MTRFLFLLLVVGFRLGASAEPPPASKATFIRTADLPDGGRGLQTATVSYRSTRAAGPTVTLIGVAHLGTSEYFQALQTRLDRQTVVLYEGVGLRDLQAGPGAVRDEGIQTTLAKALGLQFQLNAIDYRRSHFVNSDLQVPELEKEVKERAPENSSNPGDTFDQILGALQGSGPMAGVLKEAATLLGATPQMQEMTKSVLIEALGQAGELLALGRAASPEIRDLLDVILTQRNEIVMRDLQAQLRQAAPTATIAIFYGAAHMDELARHLQNDLGYTRTETQWETAFSARPADAGVNPVQLQMLLQMLRSQLPGPPEK